MSLEDELKLQKANEKISNLMTELNESKEKISNLMTEFNESKNKEIMLSGEVRSLQAEMKYLETKIKNTDILNDRVEFLEKERKSQEEQINKLEQKVEKLSEDKDNLLKEKTEALEGKNEILQQMTQKELELQEKDQKIGELRDKFKNSSSDLLSKSMEIEKLVKKIKTFEENGISEDSLKAKDDKIEALEVENTKLHKEIENLKSEYREEERQRELNEKEESKNQEVDVISHLDEAINRVKKVLPEGKNTIRLVIPEINDIEKFGFMEIIKQIPDNVILNIAAKIEDPFGDPFVRDVKKFCQLTNYSEKKFIAVNIDSTKFLIGIFKDDKIHAIYTEVSDFIELFKQAIMEPFINGKRIF